MIYLKQLLNTLTLLMALFAAYPVNAEAPKSTLTPREAIARLQEGNARFFRGGCIHPHCDPATRRETVRSGQHPFATVVSCSDSRVPVELLFDQGVGDLFVIRVAGNVCDTDEIGSIEYGAEHLDTPLVLVLGHTRCGAVTAVATGAKVHGCLEGLLDNIGPAVKQVRAIAPHLDEKAMIAAVVKANVFQSMEDLLRGSSELRERVKDHRVEVQGAIYDVATGRVQWLGPHPWQSELLIAAAQPPAPPQAGHAQATQPAADRAATAHPPVPVTPAAQREALAQLKEGNVRYTTGRAKYPHLDRTRLTEIAEEQHPIATVLACSDSRVPVEEIFDQGLGDLFVVRIAGNVSDTDETASVEYGVSHLHTPVLVVLGHTHCGAVTAVANHAELHGNIEKLVDNIKPAVEAAHAEHPTAVGQELVEWSVRQNVRQSIRDLIARSPEVRDAIAQDRLKVVGGIYDLDSGKVEWLEDEKPLPPIQTQPATTPARAAGNVPARSLALSGQAH